MAAFVDEDALAASVRKLDPASAAKRLAGATDTAIADLLAALHIGHAVEILEEFAPGRRERIAAATPFGEGQLWLQRHRYAEGTVGRLLQRPPAVFAAGTTVGETIGALREIVRKHLVVYLFVTAGDGRLIGVVAFRELLFAHPLQTLADIMLREPFCLRPEQPLAEAMREVVKRHYPVYPVCDSAGHLLGLVRGQVMFEQQTFEVSAQAGSMVGVEKEERLATPWLRSLRFRSPWLLLNMLITFGAASTIGLFDATIQRHIVLAAFLPVIAGQCSNLGAQALAVTIRGITLGEVYARIALKEAWLGFVNGAISGLLAGAVLYVTASDDRSGQALALSAALFAAMTLSCTLAGVAGTAIPVLLRRLGADPATASVIFLSTVTDIASLAFFLGFVVWILN
jgi:magnesium transporter